MHKHRASPGENEENRGNEGWGKPERGGEINPSKEEKEGGTNREDGGGGARQLRGDGGKAWKKERCLEIGRRGDPVNGEL